MSQLHSTIDPRPALEKMRRTHLERFLSAMGLPFAPDAPATTLRRIAIDNGLTGREQAAIDAMAPPKPDPRIEESQPIIRNDQKKYEMHNLDIDSLSMPQARKLCKALGLPQNVRDKLQDIKDRIRVKVNEQNPA